MRSEKKDNILIYPSTSEIGHEVYNSLAWNKEFNLYSASSDSPHSLPLNFVKHINISPISTKNWVNELNEVIQNNNIGFIIPCHDSVLFELSENRENIEAKLVAPSQETCRICRSKKDTYSKLKDIISTPHIYNSPNEIEFYPAFSKPDQGQGAIGAVLIENVEQAVDLQTRKKENFLMEFLPGEEYTIDCFSQKNHELLFLKARKRKHIRGGICVEAEAIDSNEFLDMGSKISKELKLLGAWFFQVKRDALNKLKLLEVAPRISGSSGISRMHGANLSTMNLYLHREISLKTLLLDGNFNVSRKLTSYTSYRHDYQTIYVDFDDSLILNGKINTNLIKFLYQSINRNKQLKLITRHNGDLVNTLKRLKLFELWDEIIHLGRDEPKSEYITSVNSIFIDDSFRERLDVASKLNIPTFDCSMIEALIND